MDFLLCLQLWSSMLHVKLVSLPSNSIALVVVVLCLEVCLLVQTRPAGSKYDSLSVLQSFHRLSSGRPPLLEEFRGRSGRLCCFESWMGSGVVRDRVRTVLLPSFICRWLHHKLIRR